MKKGNYVRIEKLETTPDAFVKTANEKEWVHGQDNRGLTPPIGYWNEGYLLEDVVANKSIYMERHIRNGVKATGYFETSPIKLIVGEVVTTQNSVYRVVDSSPVEN